MFRPPAKRVYDWEKHMLPPEADTHTFPLPEARAVAALEPLAFLPTEPRTLAALEPRAPALTEPPARVPPTRPAIARRAIFVVPELPVLAVPEFLAAPVPAPTHPHRRPLRWERARRPGSIPHPPTYCQSPVRRSHASQARGGLAP